MADKRLIYGSLEKRYSKPGRVIVGVDEVGRGCLAGPITVGAVVLPPSLYRPAIKFVKKSETNNELWWYLNKEGSILPKIKDSKAFNQDDRARLCPLVANECSAYAVVHRSAEFIDECGISQAFIMASREAVTRVLREVPGITDSTDILCVIDGSHRFVVPNVTTRCIPKADTASWSVAAASMLAKVQRDSMMIHYHDHVDGRFAFDDHKGYGTEGHLAAIVKHGICPIHRKSFHVTLPTGRVKLSDLA